MDAVIEIGVVRKIVYSNPFDWFPIAQARAHGLEIRAVSPDLFVTVHTGFRRRHSCRRRNFDGGVTVAAINAVVTYVVLVTELDRLLALYPLPGVPGRAIDLGANPKRGKKNEDGAKNTKLGKGVGAVVEDLWHRRRFANPIRGSTIGA